MTDHPERTCPRCGEPVQLRNVRARFCSSDCRDKHHSRRNRALRESADRIAEFLIDRAARAGRQP